MPSPPQEKQEARPEPDLQEC
ncbi:hypothetical protein G7K71_18710 [Desulfofundulus sp. TPOSR]|nr:hypothetical protein [Desulfofundulus sp. TPOSR]